ncbi:MAG: hypothetical protein ACRDOC_18580, partial [Streptosporangiaceae bacterium]
CFLPQLLQLLARAVVPHADIVDDALGLLLAAPELILLTAAQVNLVGDSRGRSETAIGGDMARAICDSPTL